MPTVPDIFSTFLVMIGTFFGFRIVVEIFKLLDVYFPKDDYDSFSIKTPPPSRSVTFTFRDQALSKPPQEPKIKDRLPVIKQRCPYCKQNNKADVLACEFCGAQL